MGESVLGFGIGGGDTKSKNVLDPRATQAKQQAANTANQDKFINKYTSLFASPTSNPGMADSLSGYFGGKTIPEIAAMLAKTNAFQPQVAPVTHKVTTK